MFGQHKTQALFTFEIVFVLNRVVCHEGTRVLDSKICLLDWLSQTWSEFFRIAKYFKSRFYFFTPLKNPKTQHSTCSKNIVIFDVFPKLLKTLNVMPSNAADARAKAAESSMHLENILKLINGCLTRNMMPFVSWNKHISSSRNRNQ